MADFGKFGHGYLIALWFCMAVVVLAILVSGFPREAADNHQDRVLPEVPLFLGGVAVIHSIVALGVFRRRRWAYYASFAIALYWVLTSGHSLFSEGTRHRWAYSLFFVPGVIALIWLITPSSRAQFRPAQGAPE